MCESSVYVTTDGHERLVLADVVLVRPAPGGLYVEDILGASREIPGRIELIDLANHRIVISDE